MCRSALREVVKQSLRRMQFNKTLGSYYENFPDTAEVDVESDKTGTLGLNGS